jgi:hypothetical protein
MLAYRRAEALAQYNQIRLSGLLRSTPEGCHELRQEFIPLKLCLAKHSANVVR